MGNKRVMLSYSHKDDMYAQLLEHLFSPYPVEIFRDRSVLSAGENWLDAILTSIRASDHLLLILTENSLKSKYVQSELSYAQCHSAFNDLHAFILPVKMAACELPDWLSRYQIADLVNDPDAGAIYLKKALGL